MDIFLTSTVAVFLAELGDKTQLLSLVLAARFKKPWPIIAGILIATLINHAASAWLGAWFSQFLNGQIGQWIIGSSFIAVGLWLLIPDKEEAPHPYWDKYGAFLVATILFFLAEIGDKTQIATILLGANYNSVFVVTLGTTAGMLLANVPVVFAGSLFMNKIPLKATRIIAALVFILTGVYSLMT
jgi:putative Ca2+/H+ antiporter (TMEM165/GDT1 family)